MMRYKLIKASSPGWEKDFATKEEATEELRKYICYECMDDLFEEYSYNLADLLSTSCGCEFWVEEEGEE